MLEFKKKYEQYFSRLNFNEKFKFFIKVNYFTSDTTLSLSDDNLSQTFVDFYTKLVPFFDKILINQLTINWSKTKLMLITKQRTARSSSLIIDGCCVEVVDEFELLGITIDQKLLFNKT